MTRLTLDIDEQLLARANAAAAAQNCTVEEMVKRFLHVLGERPLRREDLPPRTRGALGMLKGLPNRPDNQLLEEALEEKYGPPK